MKTSATSTGEQPFGVRLLLACGALGPLLFIVVFLLEGATRPHYSPWRHAVSLLSQGEGGWMQITNFVVCGALVFAFAIGLRRTLRTGPGSTWGPILLAVFSLCLIGAGVFVTDPALGYPPGASGTMTEALSHPSVHGTLHNLLSLCVFSSLSAVCFVLARRDAADPAERGWAWYDVATGILVAVFVVVTVLVTLLNGPGGFMERIFLIAGWGWIALLAIRLMSKKA